MSTAAASTVLVVAGFVAGVIGTAGGVTSLVSFPALLLVGVPPLPANVANLVAATACWPGSALTSRRELAGSRRRLARELPVAAGGAVVGTVLLLHTPAAAFARLVPVLVLTGSLVLLAQPWLTARVPRRRADVLVLPLLGLVAIYSGYFGAGAGILFLTVQMVVVDDRLPEANATKNMLLGAGTVASTVVFVALGPVDWVAVLPLAVGLFAGSTLGPVVARRLSPTAVRWAVSAFGVVLAVGLWVDQP